MWQQQQQQEAHMFPEKSEKYCQEPSGDSGFLSGDCMYSSEFSSSTSLSGDIQSASIDSSNIMDSDIDLGLSNSFDQLSLKQTSLNQQEECKLQSTYLNDDSGIISLTKSIEEVEETCQTPCQFVQNDDGDTLLHTAIIQGYLELSVGLINITPQPSFLDILNDDSQTALHLAVITNQPQIVRRLVLAGADLSIRNYQGNTALHLACTFGNLDCAKALTEPVATFETNLLSQQRLPTIPQNLEQRNYHGETCLHIAASRDDVDLVGVLVERGAELEAQESLAGRTVLHLALERGCTKVVRYLLDECRPRLDAVTYSGCTAYEIASCIDKDLARQLLRMDATADQMLIMGADEFRQQQQGFFGATAASA